jgi:predicted O-methyltransferase YrrM
MELGKSLFPAVIVNYATAKLNLYGFRSRLASATLNKKANKCSTPKELIELSHQAFVGIPSRYIGWSIKPAQVHQEIEALLAIVEKSKIDTMLEIGTCSGGTLFLFSRMLNRSAKLISLDMPEGKFGFGYRDYKRSFYTNFARDNQTVYLLREDSHAKESLNKIKAILKGKKLDFLFIDGDHTYEGVKKDFEMYSPLVRKGGLIAFHDVCVHSAESGCNVNKFWEEIKNCYEHEELIKDVNQKWAGIGVIYT